MSIEFRFVQPRRDAGILCEVNSAVPFRCLAPGGINSSSSSETDYFGAYKTEVFVPSLADTMEGSGVCAAMALTKLTVDEVDVKKRDCVSQEESLELLQAEAPPV
jgi:hypothetical protein